MVRPAPSGNGSIPGISHIGNFAVIAPFAITKGPQGLDTADRQEPTEALAAKTPR